MPIFNCLIFCSPSFTSSTDRTSIQCPAGTSAEAVSQPLQLRQLLNRQHGGGGGGCPKCTDGQPCPGSFPEGCTSVKCLKSGLGQVEITNTFREPAFIAAEYIKEDGTSGCKGSK